MKWLKNGNAQSERMNGVVNDEAKCEIGYGENEGKTGLHSHMMS